MAQNHAHGEPWAGVDEVAAHRGVRRARVYSCIDGRGLAARNIGKLSTLNRSALDTWVATVSPGASQPAPAHPTAGTSCHTCTRTSGLLRDSLLARIPVIVLTAERSAHGPGFTALLRKPLDLGRPADALDQAFRPRLS